MSRYEKIAAIATKSGRSTAPMFKMEDIDKALLDRLMAAEEKDKETGSRDWDGLGRAIAEICQVVGHKSEVPAVEVTKDVWDKLSPKQKFVTVLGHLNGTVHNGDGFSIGPIKVPASGIRTGFARLVDLYQKLETIGVVRKINPTVMTGVSGPWVDEEEENPVRLTPPADDENDE